MSSMWWALVNTSSAEEESGTANKSDDNPQRVNRSEELQSGPTTEISDPINGRRPRGRPPGSKNKPKPATIITRDSPNSLRTHVLDILSGTDILGSISAYAQRRHCGVLILSCVGNVSRLILQQIGGEERQFHGRFQVILLHGSFLPTADASGLTALIAGPRGELAGGAVRGPMVADGPVMVIASMFRNATFERLPLEEDLRVHPTTTSPATAEDSPAASHSFFRNNNGYVPAPPPPPPPHDVFWHTPLPRPRPTY